MKSILQLVAACLFAAVSLAQPVKPLSPDRVTFYTEPGFKGDSLVVEAGAQVPNLSTMRRESRGTWLYTISSVQVEGAATATVHSLTGFRGDELDIRRSIPDLYGELRTSGGTWDRSIASIVVTAPQHEVIVQQPPPTTVIVQQPPPPTTVVVVPPPPPPPRLSPREADAIVTHAFRDVLNRPPDPAGLRTYRQRLIDDGWNEKQIIEQLQRSNEARSINADEAITRMYREVLGRDPDANGLAHYRAKWKDGWTQGQILDDLRRSDEGRATYIRITVTRAYKDLLGREPDPGGYAVYERLMREKGYTEEQVRAAIRSGDEYRQRNRRG